VASIIAPAVVAALVSSCGAGPCANAPAAASAHNAPAPARGGVKDGGVQMVKVDGKFKVWTKRVGSGPVSVLTLHGGPGCSHDYFECFEDFLPPHGVQIVFYDQLGSGRSDRPDDKSLWTMGRFVEEVEQVRAALGLEDFYLLGHSWGGYLAIEYALKYQRHLRGLVLSNTSASQRSVEDYGNELLARDASPEAVAKIHELEARGVHEGREYDAVFPGDAMDKHLCGLPHPWPEPMVYACYGAGHNAQLSETMAGAHRSFLDGNLRDWNRWNDLHGIAVPTLTMGGKNDFYSPADAERMAASIPGAHAVVLQKGGHMAMYDDQDAYFAALLGFLDATEAAHARRQ